MAFQTRNEKATETSCRVSFCIGSATEAHPGTKTPRKLYTIDIVECLLAEMSVKPNQTKNKKNDTVASQGHSNSASERFGYKPENQVSNPSVELHLCLANGL